MRSFLSTVLGLALVVGLFVAGGAASSPAEAPSPVARLGNPPLPVAAPFATAEAIAPVPTAPGPATPVPEPGADEARVAWFGCAPPRADTVCGPLERSGPASLVPRRPTDAADWRPLVAAFFAPEDVDRALRVIQCESKGDSDAKNPRSTASGLFQHLASMWPPRASAAGFTGVDVFDPVANVGTAAWLVYEGGGWSHWYPSRPCWSR